jgi:Domain of unknown function (DUF4149)
MASITDYILLTIITIFPVISLGVMIFFSFIITPTIFRFLPAAQAGLYVRKLFPIYYIFNGSIVLISAIAISSLGVFNPIFYSNVIVLSLFIVNYFYLMPAINKAKGKNNKKFKILHTASVASNSIQILLLVYIVILLLDF